jgi:hypothetical protein
MLMVLILLIFFPFMVVNQLLFISLQVFRAYGRRNLLRTRVALIQGNQILIDLRLQLPPGGLIQSMGLAEVLGDPPHVITLPQSEVHYPKQEIS